MGVYVGAVCGMGKRRDKCAIEALFVEESKVSTRRRSDGMVMEDGEGQCVGYSCD